ncbi:E3 ubiquitin-protein ligase RNF13-like [Pollicipes pollicipes]|uniref:E3 ubiquitin-protein ligase RNF13-like n=1 Tax=Pollicipes pollicipes TaxID=41117 RepID=UPI0018857A00|nr:E3 ubiquitin-protein ligase RNF13-like [Pollicipes pollicipes]
MLWPFFCWWCWCRPCSHLLLRSWWCTASLMWSTRLMTFSPTSELRCRSRCGGKGFLILGQPVNGCAPLEPPPSNATDQWFVLLRAYNCSDDTKVLNAQKAGYMAAIVHNVGSDEIMPMNGTKPVDIPSFFVGETDGIMMRVNFLYGSGYHLILPNEIPLDFLAFLIPSMLLVCGCILILVAIMMYRCCCQYVHSVRRRLPQRVLNKIPTKQFDASKDEEDTCAICLDDYADADTLRVLPCSHMFHAACVDPWLTRTRRVCPVCKRRLFSATLAYPASDSEEESLLAPQRPEATLGDRPHIRTTYGSTLTGRGGRPAPALVRDVSERPQPPRTHRPPVAVDAEVTVHDVQQPPARGGARPKRRLQVPPAPTGSSDGDEAAT